MVITKTTPEMTTFGEALNSYIADLQAVLGADDTGLLALGDTPSTYAGQAGLGLIVNGTEDGLIFGALSGGGPATFVGLTDGPMSWGDPYQTLEINAAGNGLQWADPPPAPLTTFLQLLDTPESYTDYEGMLLCVDPDGGGLIFSPKPAPGVTTFAALTDTADQLGDVGQFVYVNSDGVLDFTTIPAQAEIPEYWTQLLDTPASIQPGWYLRGNVAGTALEFGPPPTAASIAFEHLSNTPSNLALYPERGLRINLAGNAVETFVIDQRTNVADMDDMPGGYGTAGYLLETDGAGNLSWVAPASGGVADWVDLGDTVSSMGSNGQYVSVVAGQLDFVDLPTIPTDIDDLGGFPTLSVTHALKYLRVNAAGDGVEFTSVSPGGGPTVTSTAIPPIMTAVTDETSIVTTGTGKVTFRAPYAFTLGEVRASLTTASSSGTVDVDVKDSGGSSIFSTILTIDATEKTSVTATTPAVLSTTAISDDDEFSIDISAAGTNAVGLKVTFIPA